MRLLQIPMNSTSVSKNNLLDVSQLSPLDSKKASAFVEISWATTQSSKIRSLHSELQWTFFTIKSDNDIVVPFFWPQPAFLRDHYQPFWFTTFCHIHKSFGASHNTHHAARTLSLPQDTYARFAFSRKYEELLVVYSTMILKEPEAPEVLLLPALDRIPGRDEIPESSQAQSYL